MPNNPGRIDGDYSIGKKEAIKYVQPPEGFGTIRKNRRYTVYLIAFVAIIVIIAFILFR